MANFEMYFSDKEREEAEAREREEAKAKITPIPEDQRTTEEEASEAFDELFEESHQAFNKFFSNIWRNKA